MHARTWHTHREPLSSGVAAAVVSPSVGGLAYGIAHDARRLRAENIREDGVVDLAVDSASLGGLLGTLLGARQQRGDERADRDLDERLQLLAHHIMDHRVRRALHIRIRHHHVRRRKERRGRRLKRRGRRGDGGRCGGLRCGAGRGGRI